MRNYNETILASGEAVLQLKHLFCQADSPHFLLVLIRVADMEEHNNSRGTPCPPAWSLPLS